MSTNKRRVPSAMGAALCFVLCWAGCGGGSSSQAFVGVWSAESGSTTGGSCTTPASSPIPTFDIKFQPGASGGLDLVTLDSDDAPLGTCLFHFSLNGSTASLAGTQSCTFGTGSAASTSIWTADTFKMSGAGDLDENGMATFAGCGEVTVMYHYTRKQAAGTGAPTGSGSCAKLLACCNAASAQNKTACMAAYDATQPAEVGCNSAYTGLQPMYCPNN